MKTASKFLMVLTIIVAISITGCRDTKKEESQEDHGHSHDEGTDHTHGQEEVKQEEFTIGQDSVKIEEKTHTHENGEGHHDH